MRLPLVRVHISHTALSRQISAPQADFEVSTSAEDGTSADVDFAASTSAVVVPKLSAGIFVFVIADEVLTSDVVFTPPPSVLPMVVTYTLLLVGHALAVTQPKSSVICIANHCPAICLLNHCASGRPYPGGTVPSSGYHSLPFLHSSRHAYQDSRPGRRKWR